MVNSLLREVYEKATVVKSGTYYTSVNELCDQMPALRPDVLWAATRELLRLGTFEGNKILSEEDKGAPLATALSLTTGMPLCMARWYPYAIPGQLEISMKNEYFSGKLYLNGVAPGDKLILIEDTISTGGTMIALIEAARALGAEVVEALALVEKFENDGCEKVRAATGVAVKTAMKISVKETGVAVL